MNNQVFENMEWPAQSQTSTLLNTSGTHLATKKGTLLSEEDLWQRLNVAWDSITPEIVTHRRRGVIAAKGNEAD